MDAPHICDQFLKGRAKVKKVNHGRPPPLVVVSQETNIAMVNATISALHGVFCPKPKTRI